MEDVSAPVPKPKLQHGARGLRMGEETLAMHAISRQAAMHEDLNLVYRVKTSLERSR